MTKHFILGCLSLAILVMSCKSGGSDGGTMSPHGFKLDHFHKTGGVLAKAGDVAMIHNVVYAGEEELFSTYKRFGESVPFEVLALTVIDSMPKDQKDNMLPFYDAITAMAAGDSLYMYQPITAEMRPMLPPTIDSTVTELKQFFFIERLTTQEAVQKEQEAKMAESAMRGEAVAATVGTAITDFKAGKLNSKIAKTDSGLKVYMVEEGTGAAITPGESLKVEYYGALQSNGNRFDDSFSRGQPLPVTAGGGRMIKGFDEGIMLLKHGSKAVLFIPWAIAYGEAGSPPNIPAKSDLAFYVEVQ